MSLWGLLGLGGSAADDDAAPKSGSTEEEGLVQQDEPDIAPEWVCVLSRDGLAPRTLDVADVHQQRLRQRPALAPWEASENILIENPLLSPSATAESGIRPGTTYAAAARACNSTVSPPTSTQTPAATLGSATQDAEPNTWIKVGRVHQGRFQRDDIHCNPIDWVEACKGSRVARRNQSRTFFNYKPMTTAANRTNMHAIHKRAALISRSHLMYV